MSLQKMIPLSLAVIAGVVNGIYVFKPYLENKDEAGKLALPNANSASASSAPEAPQQPKTATQPTATESSEKTAKTEKTEKR